MSTIRINPDLSIPERDLRFTFTTSGGPGGQNVNKVATRATISFNLARCDALTDDQRALIRIALFTRISKEGILRVVCNRFRTQEANRKLGLEIFRHLLAVALRPRRVRKKTKPTRASSQRRLTGKRVRSEIKRARRSRASDD